VKIKVACAGSAVQVQISCSGEWFDVEELMCDELLGKPLEPHPHCTTSLYHPLHLTRKYSTNEGIAL
jgi:hypothetical protein